MSTTTGFLTHCWRQGRLATKPLLMPALGARLAAGPRGLGHRRTAAAQAFSWGGDVALMGRGRVPFLTGLGFFLAAQVAYLSAYRSRSSVGVLATPGRRRFLLVGGLAASGVGLAAAREDRAMGVPVAVYGITLTTMVAAAAAIDRDQGRDRVLLGASLFLASDTLIGVRKFLLADGAPAVEAAIMATYGAGQWCIGEGMSGS